MNEPNEDEDTRKAVQEAAEHADRAGQERQTMRRKASLAEAADDARRADELEREAAAHDDEAHEHEKASADRAQDAD